MLRHKFCLRKGRKWSESLEENWLWSYRTVVLITKFHCNPELRIQLHYQVKRKIGKEKSNVYLLSLLKENCFYIPTRRSIVGLAWVYRNGNNSTENVFCNYWKRRKVNARYDISYVLYKHLILRWHLSVTQYQCLYHWEDGILNCVCQNFILTW
jgi:hypothetical protein